MKSSNPQTELLFNQLRSRTKTKLIKLKVERGNPEVVGEDIILDTLETMRNIIKLDGEIK